MNKITLILLLAMLSNIIHAQQITNVQFVQNNYHIEIRYDLSEAFGHERYSSAVYLSENNGLSYNKIPKESLEGVFSGLINGDYEVLWTPLDDFPKGIRNSEIKFKIALYVDTVSDVENNEYRTVHIGEQVWMAENLKTTKFNDGTDIPNVTDSLVWTGLNSEAYAWYNNDIINKDLYGALYNKYIVNDKNVCPEGWHIPSKEDWEELENTLSQDGYSNNTGTVLKAESFGGTDLYGFAALPGGNRDNEAVFNEIDESGLWWLLNPNTHQTVWNYRLSNSSNRVISEDNQFTFGNSVRCIKGTDIEVLYPIRNSGWKSDIEQIISWADNTDDNVKIELFKGVALLHTISSSTESDGSYLWTVPSDLPIGTDYQLKITSTSDENLFDQSVRFFANLEMEVFTPTAGSNIDVGSMMNITWEYNIDENIKIDLYRAGEFVSAVTPSAENDGTFTLAVPNIDAGTNYNIRITDVTDDYVYAESGYFEINGNIEIALPAGGFIAEVGGQYPIIWADNIKENVKIELLKGGALLQTIENTTESDGLYLWSAPDDLEIGNDYQIKITSTENENVNDETYEFSIEGMIEITSPIAGYGLQAGEEIIILWLDNVPENVKIELYKAEVFSMLIESSTTSDGIYNWELPDDLAEDSDYQIKISSTSDETVYDISDFFTVEEIIKIVSPAGGYVWEHDGFIDVAWIDNITDNVKIELFKTGVLYEVLESSSESDGSYAFYASDDLPQDNDYQIKIASVLNESVSDTSDLFAIGGTLEIISPSNGQSLEAGGMLTILWNDNITENVKIELYKNAAFSQLIEETEISDGEYIWELPEDLPSGNDYQIKISSTTDATLFDISDNFTISESIQVTAPIGGFSIQAGGIITILWMDNIDANVKIELYKGAVFSQIIESSTLSDGEHLWELPGDLEQASNYSIKITSIDDETVFDESDNFSISGAIKITLPYTGFSIETGGLLTILWIDNIDEDVKIDLYKGGTFSETLISYTESSGTYVWNIPSDMAVGSDYQIKITSISDETIFDESDNFSINKSIAVTSPTAGYNLTPGIPHTILWTSSISDDLKIDLYTGETFTENIISSTVNDGEYIWNVSESLTAADNYHLKILSTVDENIFGISDDFSIDAAVSIIFPTSGSTLSISTVQTILWTDNLDENIKIELYKDGSFVQDIEASVESSGAYLWTVPILSTGIDYQIKIISTIDSGIFDISDNFEIE